MKRSLPWLGLALGGLAFGCSGSPPKRAVPESQIVKSGPGSETHCPENAYDPSRGCVKHAWGVPVSARFRNQMAGGFRLIGIAIAIDEEILFESNDVTLLSQESFPLLSSAVGRGRHELGARLRYRGHGYGIFAYLSGYRFEVAESLPFDASDRDVELDVVAYEQPDVPLEKRPRVLVRTHDFR